MRTTGFAVVSDGMININTISNHRRAAIVNWLVIEHHLFISDGMSDDIIDSLWQNHKGTTNRVHEVDISVGPLADKA